MDFYRAMNEEPSVGHREESLRPLRMDGEQLGDLITFLKSLTGRPILVALLAPLPK
jgi:hypothetical protein